MSVQASLAKIEHYLNQAKEDDAKLASGVKSAAPKVRSSLLEIGKLVSESRKLALDHGKAIPTKKRVPKVESKESESDESPPEPPALERQDASAGVKVAEPEASETPTIKPKRGRKPKQAPVAA